MQNTSVTEVSMADATLCPNVTRAARLCSRNAICRSDHDKGELRNKFKYVRECIKHDAPLIGPSAAGTVIFQTH